MKKVRMLALLGAALFTQVAAQAGELTLYEHDNFGGRSVTLHGTAPNLSELGFNDRASSMVVRGGRWEVCVHAEFGGACRVLEPGEYPSNDRLNDKISSARELERGGGGRWHGHEGRGRRGMIELFTLPDLRGHSTRVVRDTDDLGEVGFNDRGFSLLVEEGTWQLCSDAGYGGVCRLYEPGRYQDLGRALSGRVSSARLVDGRSGGRWRDRDDDDAAPVMLFPEARMRGRPLPLLRDANSFSAFNFNDRAGSIIVNEGQWEFCMHDDFGGRCVVFGPGEYSNLDGMNNQISSARRLRR